MSARRPAAPPLWFQIALVTLVAGVLHVCGIHTIEHGGVQLGFIGWLVSAGIAIWGALQAATTATVAFLTWAYGAVLAGLAAVYNAAVDIAGAAMRGIRSGWQFFRDTYDHVLKPAWQKFWRLVDIVKDTLEDVLGPVIRWLRRIRQWVLDFYTLYVRPVLDAIGVARKILHVFSALGFKWARRLDEQLAKLEERINAPFLLVLRKLNEVIGIVNRVITANGLFQRLALVRSIERDVKYAFAALHNSRSKPLTTAERRASAAANQPPTIDEIGASFERYAQTGDGDFAEIYRLGADAAVFLDVPILREP
jgi:hypothetical protein